MPLQSRGELRQPWLVPSKTFGHRDIVRQNKQRAARGEVDPPVGNYWRPSLRSECRNGPRPCPFIACRFHLYMEVTPRGGLRMPYGEDPEGLHRMTDTCALDIAERGPVTLEFIAKVQVITRERVRQIELTAMRRMEEALASILADDDDFGRVAKQLLAEQATAQPKVSLRDFKRDNKPAKIGLRDWLSEVGSPPID